MINYLISIFYTDIILLCSETCTEGNEGQMLTVKEMNNEQ